MNERIKSDPAVMLGKPVIDGTRITVELILEKLAAGETREQILDSYPRLTVEDIAAAEMCSVDGGSTLRLDRIP